MLNKFQLWLFRRYLAKLARREEGINKIFTEIILAHNEAHPEIKVRARNAHLAKLFKDRLQVVKK